MKFFFNNPLCLGVFFLVIGNVLSFEPNINQQRFTYFKSNTTPIQIMIADVLTDFFQRILLRQTLSRDTEEDIKGFLRGIIKIRNSFYHTPEFWYLRQG